MKKIRRKEVLEAVQFRAGEQDGDLCKYVSSGQLEYKEDGTALIDTIIGEKIVQPGWWIIANAAGELHVCRPDNFANYYELANQ